MAQNVPCAGKAELSYVGYHVLNLLEHQSATPLRVFCDDRYGFAIPRFRARDSRSARSANYENHTVRVLRRAQSQSRLKSSLPGHWYIQHRFDHMMPRNELSVLVFRRRKAVDSIVRNLVLRRPFQKTTTVGLEARDPPY